MKDRKPVDSDIEAGISIWLTGQIDQLGIAARPLFASLSVDKKHMVDKTLVEDVYLTKFIGGAWDIEAPVPFGDGQARVKISRLGDDYDVEIYPVSYNQDVDLRGTQFGEYQLRPGDLRSLRRFISVGATDRVETDLIEDDTQVGDRFAAEENHGAVTDIQVDAVRAAIQAVHARVGQLVASQ